MEFDRRGLILGLATIAAAARAPAASRPASWFDRAVVIDALGGVGDPYGDDGALRMSDRAWSDIRATGVTMVRDTVMPVGNVADPWADFLRDLADKKTYLAANPDRLLPIRSAADILRARREGRFGVLLGTQDSCMIGAQLDRLAQLRKDGVLTVQLTYNNRNLSGDGALEPADAGLSRLGRATIERIESERLLLDLSHGGARTMAEAAAQAKRPPVISHTGARALADHPRNTSDATIRAVADKGGVTGIYFMPFLTMDSRPRGSDLIRHIEHVANIAGEDHVGLGTDNGVLPLAVDAAAMERNRRDAAARSKAGIAAPGEAPDILPMVADYNSLDRYGRLADALAARGWSRRRLEKLLGGNFLRVYGEAWGG